MNNTHGDGQGYVQLSSHNASFDALDLYLAKHITTNASDGQECDGWLFTPRSASAHEPPPTVVLVRGGPFPSHNLDVPVLTAAGYVVLCPNYRGSSDYSGVIALLKKGIAENLVDKSRVAIGGCSQGGFLSFLAVARNDFTFKPAVCGGVVFDWDMLTRTNNTYCLEANRSGGAP